MSTLKGRSSTAWETIFTPKWYGIVDGSGSADQWNDFTGVIKVYIGGEWVAFWPPGTSGGQPAGGYNVVMPASITAYKFNLSPTDSRADIYIELDGDVGRATGDGTEGTFVDLGDWIDNKTGLDSTDFQYNVTKTSGSTPSGTSIHANTTTWDTFTTELHWWFIETGVGAPTCELELQIREIADTSNIDTMTINLSAQVEP